MENILDRELSHEGAMMPKKYIWTQATSATAATDSKRSRSAEGRGWSSVQYARLGSGCGLQRETNWQQLWTRLDDWPVTPARDRPIMGALDLIEPGTVALWTACVALSPGQHRGGRALSLKE